MEGKVFIICREIRFGEIGHVCSSKLCDARDYTPSRDFLLGTTREKKRMHLVGWNKIIKPKEKGDLGIQATRAKNLALLAKLN